MSFPCISCGLCCRFSKCVLDLQFLQNEKQLCRNFDEQTNKCKIYKSRPLICNIDEMYKQKYCHQMSKKEFYLANLNVCYELNFIYGKKDDAYRLKKIIKRVERMESF